MANLDNTINKLAFFQSNSLTAQITNFEKIFRGAGSDDCAALLAKNSIDEQLLANAFDIKRLVGQINVVIHALGILETLPYLLKKDEKIQVLSLGAGNTGRSFDLETNLRVAEFKFINWQGGSEAIRQNQLFIDFYGLAESDTVKEKYLFVLGKQYPLKFFNGKRSLASVLSKNNSLWKEFVARYGQEFSVVRDYFLYREKSVHLTDLCEEVPFLIAYQ